MNNFQFFIEIGGVNIPGSLFFILLFFALGVFSLAFLYGLRYFIRSSHHLRQTLLPGKKRVILLVLLPKEALQSKENKEITLQSLQEDIATSETIFGALGGIRAERGFKAFFFGRDDHVSIEIVAQNEMISFYVTTPFSLRTYIEEQIHAQFPYAHIEEIHDYCVIEPDHLVFTGALSLRRHYLFPLKTYKKMDGDPLEVLLQPLAKLSSKEAAIIQIMFRSARRKWRRAGVKTAREMKQGKKPEEVFAKIGANIFWRVLYALGPSLREMVFPRYEKDKLQKNENGEHRLSPLEEELIKSIEEKSSKAGLDVNVRILVASKEREHGKMTFDTIMNAFSQYAIYQYGNAFILKTSAKSFFAGYDLLYRNFDEKKSFVLNTEELTSLVHFPLPSTTTPHIRWLLARHVPAPVDLPKDGLLLGKNIFRGNEKKIYLQEVDRRRHLYIIGQTGTGKSWFMEGLAVQDIQAGRGICFVDPHSDAIEHLLDRVPKERADDVIFFDPTQTDRPVGMNMLEYETDEQKLFIIDALLQIFDKLYDLRTTGGPMFEQYMRNALLLIMDDPASGSTLAEVPRVLADVDFRKLKLSRCKTLVVKDFWTKEAEKAGGEASLANMVPYITSKLTPFLANDLLRPIISQQKSAFHFREAMDAGKIILVKLSKGKIGDRNADLLGMICVNKILMAALGRADMPEEERRDFYLYIDEFQNFLTESIGIILSEARKYRLSLTIAHQFIGQLVKNNDTRIRDAIFGNVGSIAAFRVGVDDTELLTKQFAPVVNEYDLMNIEKFNAYVRLLVDNTTKPAFNMATFPLPQGDARLGKQIAELSLLKYGRDRSLVEAEMNSRRNITDSLEKDAL